MVESAGTDLHAQTGFGNQQVQAQRQQQAHARHEQAVHRVRQGVGQRYGGAQQVRNGHAVHIVAPNDGAHFFKYIDQAEGQQHLVQVILQINI